MRVRVRIIKNGHTSVERVAVVENEGDLARAVSDAAREYRLANPGGSLFDPQTELVVDSAE